MKQDQFDQTSSDKQRLWGFVESSLRKMKPITFLVFYLLVSIICVSCLGSALSIAMYSYSSLTGNIIEDGIFHWWLKGLALGLSFLVYGLSLIVIVPFVNRALFLPSLVKPFRGNAYSLETMPWFLHNSLLYIVRYSFLEYLTPSPFNIWFYKAMGMKIGKRCIINTTNISDACLITLGDYVTIGGSAYLLAHYSTEGYLVLSPLVIGSRSTIGLKATVFGNVEIGSQCVVSPHAVVLPKTRLKDKDRI